MRRTRRRSTMPRIQYRANMFRCGWDAKPASDPVFAGRSSWTTGATVDCDRTTIPAMASCETDPVIAMMEARKRAVAGTRNLRVIRPPVVKEQL
jgi:hypothetical protein